MTKEIVIGQNHYVNTGTLLQPLCISIDGQNGVDTLQFVVPDLSSEWAWRIEIEQVGQKKYRLLDSTQIWKIESGDVVEGDAKLQLVGVQDDEDGVLIWKSKMFDAKVLPSVNALQEVTPGQISDFDRIAAQVQSNTQTVLNAVQQAADSADKAQKSADTAQQYVSSITVDVEAISKAADAAQKSAASASESEKLVQQSISDISGYVSQALQSAGDASTSEQNALKSAQSATASATQAEGDATKAEDAAAAAENIVNTAINTIEAEGQKQASAIASEATQALEAISQVEQTAIAQVQTAGSNKLNEINAANAHAPQINEETGMWQTWDSQASAYEDTNVQARGPQGEQGAQGPQGETGATGAQGPAGADGIGLPAATAEDVGKIPVVSSGGTYVLETRTIEVDTTLTIPGTPADAASVGAKISGLESRIAALEASINNNATGG